MKLYFTLLLLLCYLFSPNNSFAFELEGATLGMTKNEVLELEKKRNAKIVKQDNSILIEGQRFGTTSGKAYFFDDNQKLYLIKIGIFFNNKEESKYCLTEIIKSFNEKYIIIGSGQQNEFIYANGGKNDVAIILIDNTPIITIQYINVDYVQKEYEQNKKDLESL